MSGTMNEKEVNMRALQLYLYEHPLYDGCRSEEGYLDVLIVGLDSYGSQLLDLCLQSAQDLSNSLRVDVLTDAESMKERYLRGRSALSSFFEIDNSVLEEESYGEIHFYCVDTADQPNEQPQLKRQERFKAFLSEKKNGMPGYVLISSGEDSLNRQLAALAYEYLDSEAAVIGYICEDEQNADTGNNNVFPIRVHAAERNDALCDELERMALNAHLIWQPNLNIDFESVKEEFLDPYNHESSISNVLSVKYKLHNMGIDLSDDGPEKAAAEFEQKIREPSIRDLLIYSEHKRWTAQRLCEGWIPQLNLEYCASGTTKHKKDKNNPEDKSWHICIVRSRADHMLAEHTKKEGLLFWDEASEERVSELDELDQLSVRLHRMYLEHADKAKQKNILGGEVVKEIRNLISDSPQAGAAFQEWMVCLKDLWNKDQSKFRLYKGLRNDFLKALDTIEDPTSRDAVRIQVEALETQFQPILSSSEYCDYKKKDEDLIDNIPFILTYSCKTTMIIPVDLSTDGEYKDGGNNEQVIAVQNGFVFSHLAAAAAVNPEKMIFLFDGSRANDADRKNLLALAKGASQYRQKKKLRSDINLVIAFSDSDMIQRKSRKKLEKALSAIPDVQIVSLSSETSNEIPKVMMNCLMKQMETDAARDQKEKDFSLRYYAFEEKGGELSVELSRQPEYSVLRRYSFHQKDMRFTSSNGFMAFGYIRKYPFLLVSDLLSMKKYVSTGSYYPEFHSDYAELWQKYKTESAAWKEFTGRLRQYAEDRDEIVTFGTGSLSNTAELVYNLPASCHESADKLVKSLVQYEVVGRDSYVSYCTTESCVITIQAPISEEDKYDDFFSNPYRLMNADALSIYSKSSHRVGVRFDELCVDRVYMGPVYSFGVCYDDMVELLNYFYEKHYITRPNISDDTKEASFTYATPNIKQFLISEGKMLEIYVYHKLRESGVFDDIVSGYEIVWGNESVEGEDKNELDCIATRGFTSFFIECKARRRIETEFYDKLVRSVKRVGINAVAILIADTDETGTQPSSANADKIKYGNSKNVITIWKPAEITAIDETLKRFL